MRVLVTGANGYLGQGIVKTLLNSGQQVVATGFSTEHVDNRAEKIDCNLFQVANPFEFFGRPDVLLHLAWRNGFVHDADTHILDLPQHYKFIEEMLKSGLKRVAVMGSMHEIGFFEGSINENTPCHPMNLYGIGKNALREAVCLLAKKYSAKFQWLRGFYIIGNSEFGSSIFSKITIAEHNGQESFPFTTGQNQYDFIGYSEFCSQVVSVVNQSLICGIINIGSGKPEKLADKVEQFISENHYNIELRYGVYPDRPYDSKAVWGDGKKLTEILNNEKSCRKE